MSFAYVSSPGVPTMRPRNLSGVGTVLDAGRWSTSSVVIRGSCRYSLIFRVYSSSFGCAGRAAPALCASAAAAGAISDRARAATGHASRRTGRIRRDMSFLLNELGDRPGIRLGDWTRSHTHKCKKMLGSCSSAVCCELDGRNSAGHCELELVAAGCNGGTLGTWQKDQGVRVVGVVPLPRQRNDT